MNPRALIGRVFANLGEAIGGYTEQVTGAAESQAGGGAFSGRIAIVEAIAGTLERSFAQGRLTGGSPKMRAAVTPQLLAGAGRSLIERGEWVAAVDRVRNGQWLIRPGSWEIVGGVESDDPADWIYKIRSAAPRGHIERERPRERVIHVVARADVLNSPHTGRSLASLTKETQDAVVASERRLKEELRAVTGQLVMHPGVITSDQHKTVKERLETLRGGVALIKQKQGMDRAVQTMQAERIGADPPEQLGFLRGQSAELLSLAAGIPGSFVRGGRGSEQREALRVFLFMCVMPLAGMVGAELRRVFDADVELEFSRLNAADLSGRARSAKLLTEAGVSLDRALELTGFTE